MSENRRFRKQIKALAAFIGWISWDWLPAVHWRSQLVFTASLYFDGWRSGDSRNYITYKELAHSYTLILFSFGAFGIGLGELAFWIFGK